MEERRGVFDLRSALYATEAQGELVSIRRPVDPGNEIPDVARKNARLRKRPALLFEQVLGFPGWRVATSLLADLQRTHRLFGLPEDPRAMKLEVMDRLERRIPPRVVTEAPCQQNVITQGIDVQSLIPWTHGARDVTHRYWQGPVITKDLENGRQNLAIYRTCIQGPDRVTVNGRWDRHLGFQLSDAKRANQVLPVAIVLGTDPMLIPFAALKLPYGVDDFAILGALRQAPVDLVRCRTVDLMVPAHAETIIEGEIRPPYERGDDGPWPEYLGYLGMRIHPPVVHVTAVTHRDQPINYFSIPAGGGDLYHILSGALFLQHLRRFAASFVDDCTMMPGSVHHHAVIRVRKSEPHHEGLQLNVALAAFGYLVELDRVTVVDDDINIHDPTEVEWAVATRCNPANQVHVLCEARTQQIVPIAGVRELFGDPITKGKMIVDATIPWNYRVTEKDSGIGFFTRSRWGDVDLADYFSPEDADQWMGDGLPRQLEQGVGNLT